MSSPTSNRYLERYVEFLMNHARNTRKIRIVCDCSNGMTGLVLAPLFARIPTIEAILINTEPDPLFRAHGPNPLAPGALDELSQRVITSGAELGIAFDADGDRAIFVSPEGEMIEPYVILLLLARSLPPPYVVDENVYNTLRLVGQLPEDQLVVSKVGHFYIKSNMREHGASVGAEQSGHYYFKDFFYLDSGILSALKVITSISSLSESLREYIKKFDVVTVSSSIPFRGSWEELQKKIVVWTASTSLTIAERDGLTLADESQFVNARASNTEPIVRLTAGAHTLSQAEGIIKGLADTLRSVV